MTVKINLNLGDAAPATYGLNYVAPLRLYDALLLLPSFEYWLKEIRFESRFRVRHGLKLVINRNSVDIFEIPPRVRDDAFVQVLSWEFKYEGSCLLFAPGPMVFTYCSSSTICKSRCSFSFCINVTDHSIYALTSLFMPVLTGGTVNSTAVYRRVTALPESGVLLPLPRRVHAVVSQFGLISVNEGCKLVYGQVYLAYHRNLLSGLGR